MQDISEMFAPNDREKWSHNSLNFRFGLHISTGLLTAAGYKGELVANY